MLRDRLGANPLVLQIPIGSEDKFRGVVDLVTMQAIVWDDETLGAAYSVEPIPAHLQAEAARYRELLVEGVADLDEGLMQRYLEGEALAEPEIRQAIRAGTLAMKVIPVLAGASFKNKGVQTLLDAVVDYLPSPVDLPEVEGRNPRNGEVVRRPASVKAPFAALVFKIMTDPYVGQLAFFRVYSGAMETGQTVYTPTRDRRERVGRLVRMHANKREEIKRAEAGDIAAAVGLRTARTGDTLCDETRPIVLETMDFPAPVISVAIEPKTKDGQEKLSLALSALSNEDPTFRAHTDEETGQTIISGMGELHLEIIVDRLLREFKVEANVGKPQVAYRETVTVPADAEGRFIRQTGGKGQYGHVKITLEPLPAGTGFEFANEIVGGAIPKEYIPAVEKGVKEAMENGILAGYPGVDMRLVLRDGSYHEVDSSEMAFKIAGSMAFKDAARRGKPILLEPVMQVDVVCPEEYLGNVVGDLNSRRGRVVGIEARPSIQMIRAEVPLAEMFDYATDLRSATQGRASYTMQFARYEPVPHSIAEEIIARVSGRASGS
jgi:elongation factor G